MQIEKMRAWNANCTLRMVEKEEEQTARCKMTQADGSNLEVFHCVCVCVCVCVCGCASVSVYMFHACVQ